jgi:hypothetical protein
VFAYWLTYNILKSRKPKFQPLEEASEATPGVHATVAAHRLNVHALVTVFCCSTLCACALQSCNTLAQVTLKSSAGPNGDQKADFPRLQA